jgi:hypothetical protein
VEFGGGVSAQRDVVAAIEWTAPVALSVTLLGAWGASVRRDSPASIETSTGVSGAAGVPLAAAAGVVLDAGGQIEFGHLTVSFIAEATMPLEFGRIVFRDARIGIEDRRRHKTIGAKLEPDIWEEDHEP